MNQRIYASGLILLSLVYIALPGQSLAQSPAAAGYRVSINAAGEVHDEQGQLAGHVRMNDQRMQFNYEQMDVRPDGSVVDANGTNVGRLMATQEYADAMAQQSRVQKKELSRNVTVSQPVINQDSAAEANSSGEQMSAIEANRQRVSASIQSEQSKGNLSDAQANRLQQELNDISTLQEKYERQGEMSSRQEASLYQNMIDILTEMNKLTHENARGISGLNIQ